MAELTKGERETCILANDLGQVTVWTTSPVKARQLARRLGKPATIVGECSRWDLQADSLRWMPSRKRPMSPEAHKLRASAARSRFGRSPVTPGAE